MKKLMMILCGVLLLNSHIVAKEVTKVGTTALGFLNIDVGARAVAMGGAYVAVAQNASTIYWNPSGIARINQFQAVFNYTRWIADINFNYMAVVTPVSDIGTVGINATFLSMDDMERTTISNPEGTGETFSAGNYAIGLSFARNLTDRFSVGFNLKYVNEKIRYTSAGGFAFDIGTLFTTQFNGLIIGMSISNYGSKVKMSGKDLLTQIDIDEQITGNNENINANLKADEFNLPLIFRVGVSMDLLKGLGNSNLILAVDALHPNDDVESLNVGGEYVFNKMFSLRAGYTSLFAKDTEGGLTFGGGLQYQMKNSILMLDYAYRDFGMLNAVHMFCLGLGF
jgi:long-subunit fatty acid transport protein